MMVYLISLLQKKILLYFIIMMVYLISLLQKKNIEFDDGSD